MRNRVFQFVRRLIHGRAQADADRMAARLGMNAEFSPGGPHDAFTHAYVSARLTVMLGPRLAELLGKLNEIFGSLAAGETLEAEMDRRNNAVGREIAAWLTRDGVPSNHRIAEEVKHAMDGGRLTIIEADGRGSPRLVASS